MLVLELQVEVEHAIKCVATTQVTSLSTISISCTSMTMCRCLLQAERSYFKKKFTLVVYARTHADTQTLHVYRTMSNVITRYNNTDNIEILALPHSAHESTPEELLWYHSKKSLLLIASKFFD